MTVSEISELVSVLIRPSYSARLCKLRIHQLELKFKSKPHNLERSTNVRLYVTNISGHDIDFCVYTEEQGDSGMVNKLNLRKKEKKNVYILTYF